MFRSLRGYVLCHLGLRETGMVARATKTQFRWQHSLATLLVAAFAGAGLVALHPSLAGAQDAKTSKAAQKADVSRTQALGRRVEQLEEQIVDLQVTIGTLESLAKPGGASSGAAFTNGRVASGKRDDNLEVQVQALTLQVSKLSAEVRALQNGNAGRPIASYDVQPQPQMGPPPAFAEPGVEPGPSIGSGFGATTVNPSPIQDHAATDEIGNLIQQPMAPIDQVQQAPPSQSLAEAPAGAESDAAKAVYELAYGNLLQQDYAAAQAGFRGFLRKYPEHSLVPNALYWLGETYYVQENYTDAAEAFDIVTAAYAGSNKAPDSQLKRGMSLANLGKRSEACTVLGTLSKRYPNAPEHVKSKADSERQRVGCS